VNARQLAQVPDYLLAQHDTRMLRDFLGSRGWHLSLVELDVERRRRGIRPGKREMRRRRRQASWVASTLPEEARDVS